MTTTKKMRIAVIGGGTSGLVSAYVLAKEGVDVVLYEKEDYLGGGHARTVCVDGVDLDLDFMVFNRVTYPSMVEFFESLGVDMETSDMSFSVSLDKGKGCEWGSRNGLSSLFAQKRNIFNPYFWQMIREMMKFKNDVIEHLGYLESNPDINHNETLGDFVKSRGYSELFQKAYLVPFCASIWSCSSGGVMGFSASTVLSFCRNHHLFQLFGWPQWLTVKWRSHSYVNKVKAELESRGCKIRTHCAVKSVSTFDGGCTVLAIDNAHESYDGCIIGVPAPEALSMLGLKATDEETRILGAFPYVYSDVFLHREKNLMPQNPKAWSAWNFLGNTGNKVCLTYWLNVLQNITGTSSPFLVTLNPPYTPKNTLLKWSTSHPVPSVSASKASKEFGRIQGKRGLWFCGAYQGNGLEAGMAAAYSVLKKNCPVLRISKHMVPSVTEAGARLLVTRFLGNFISTGSIILFEEGGTILSFEGRSKKSHLKCVLKIHNLQFYWKIATQADIGLADAYINGDFSFVDEEEGLLNLFMIFIANRDMNTSVRKHRGWWTPLLFTAGFASAKYFLRHVSQQNSLTQARRNISQHYDLSNDLFGLFLDETMMYSCPIFEMEGEDLKAAQLRKISLLIEKARVDSKHEVLEIGCGWGALAIEVVKKTGCKYTGITLSEEQLKYAENKVKEAGLQDRITFLLCDYRQLPDSQKYDRIIACEMIEAVGHEFMEEFFRRCDSVLAENGLLVLQFTFMPDERYDEYRKSSDFIKEYIFPGGSIPCLSRVTSAMAAASKLCVEHLENIGMNYYHTLRHWRKIFMEKQSEILALGFNEKFIRIWEYYFIYCAAGFKTRTLGNYQIVFSRPGNISTFNDPYKGYGFHEDGLKAGMVAANSVLKRNCVLLRNKEHMVPSLIEKGARLFVSRFLGNFISAGNITLLEDGGTVLSFEGTSKNCHLKSVLRVHSPQFYWKVATQADLGLADAYINGDFSFVDKEGLLNLFMIFIANGDTSNSGKKHNNKRGWWTPLFFTAGIASAKYYLRHVCRQNTLTQARRNISQHYDLSNDLFALFLDVTMTYSCAIFETEKEDLKAAQLRKISLLIEKAKVDRHHEVLEIGCGWGTLAIEVVRRTGCKYTGITLSEEQLNYAEIKVKDAGLQDRIRFLLCDYRQLPKSHKYDRIISCEMIEAVGHEFMGEFFGCCDSALAENGLLVLQFTSISDELYDEYRQSPGFMKEYIFPGGCLPSLSRLTSVMATASRLCVEHLENIGIHYYQTLRYWRTNFMEKQSQILALGFDEKFIRTWEYYFIYCAAGFRTRTLGNYQIVFFRPGNVDNLYKGVPSAY